MARLFFILCLIGTSCGVLSSKKEDADVVSVDILWPGSEDPMMFDDSTSYATGHIIHIVKADCRLEDAVLIDGDVLRVDTLQRRVLFRDIEDIR